MLNVPYGFIHKMSSMFMGYLAPTVSSSSELTLFYTHNGFSLRNIYFIYSIIGRMRLPDELPTIKIVTLTL